MVKVQYNGSISPGRVRVFGAIYHFKTGETKELDEKTATKLIINGDYKIISSTPTTSKRFSKKSKSVDEDEDKEE